MNTRSIPPTPLKQVAGLAGWIIVTAAAAALGASASMQADTFYLQLNLPDWAPPPWLFGPVWSVLYLMMAVSAWLVWRAHGFRRAGPALGVFLVQLAANALWTWLFFGWQQGLLALAEILVLWFLIAGTILAFWRLHTVAAALLVPYLAWVTFATALTYATWSLNPGVL